MKAIVRCSKPRLSDEEMDPIEQDDSEGAHQQSYPDGWLPWDIDDLLDIRRLVNDKMPRKQKEVLNAFLAGLSYEEIGVSEKHWRWHYDKAIEFIQRELKV